MTALPRISVVTPSYNQGRFIGRTIESVLAQNYPDVEHIVVDGMSTDETAAVLARYPHLRVVREPDRGQAEAINKGFRRAAGDVLCYLNSDDTLLPGALHRVVREIDPARGRHVVMGRCIYIDEDDRPTGLEHPCAFAGRDRILEVWKVHCVPQPATFWTREAWRRCGPMDETEHLVLDYDLMCRLSRRYDFHVVDQVLAAYRLQPQSKTCSARLEDVYSRAARVSRRYWGPWWVPRSWRMALSLAHARSGRGPRLVGRAAELAFRGRRAWDAGRRWHGLACHARAAALNPGAAWRRWLLFGPGLPLARRLPGAPTAALTWGNPRVPALTSQWRSFAGRHDDGHAGPRFVTDIDVPPGAGQLDLDGSTPFCLPPPEPLTLMAAIDGRPVSQGRLTAAGPFSLALPVAGLEPGPHRLEVTSNWFLVPDDYWGNGDFRPLAFHLSGLRCGQDAISAAKAA